MRASKREQLWAEFEELIRTIPPEDWECFAPRSRIADRRERMIYKLFVRLKNRPRKWWWYFEEEIGKVPPEYPDVGYEDRATNATKYVQGALELLRKIDAEDANSKPELARALRFIHARL